MANSTFFPYLFGIFFWKFSQKAFWKSCNSFSNLTIIWTFAWTSFLLDWKVIFMNIFSSLNIRDFSNKWKYGKVLGLYISSPWISKAQLLNVKCSKGKKGALKKELGVLLEKAFVWCWMFWHKVGPLFWRSWLFWWRRKDVICQCFVSIVIIVFSQTKFLILAHFLHVILEIHVLLG